LANRQIRLILVDKQQSGVLAGSKPKDQQVAINGRRAFRLPATYVPPTSPPSTRKHRSHFSPLTPQDTERQQQNGSRGYQHAAQFSHCESDAAANDNDDVDAAAAAADNLSAASANASLPAADKSVAMRSEMWTRGKFQQPRKTNRERQNERKEVRLKLRSNFKWGSSLCVLYADVTARSGP